MSESAAPTTTDLLIGIARAHDRGMITLRGDLSDAQIVRSVETATAGAVPGELCVALNGDRGAVWMAPDELLVFVPKDDVASALAMLSTDLGDLHHLALDMSDARAIYTLTGPLVAEVLSKGAPIDLSERGFPVGAARRTHLGGLAVAIWRLSDEHWEIVCLSSFAHHLQAWLEQAAVPGSEIGLTRR